MMANIYGQYDVNVQEVFRNIDGFLEDNFDKFDDKNQILNQENLMKIKILICDLTALEGLNPKEIKHREALVYELISILNMYYINNKESLLEPEIFFLTPKHFCPVF
ncbi:MAG: hypothetical protein NKF70_11400 [Methanobacterium sp. ERen5]|nr:MAG: hypothetical protein NKF70_11400 [Methanobacterium sp. ERen5]